MLPPANRSKKPKIEPACELKNCCPALDVDAGRGDVAAQPVHRQQRQREQDPLAQVRNAKDVRERFEKLHGSLRFPALFAPGAPITCAVPPAFWIFSRADLENMVRFHRDLARQLARAQNLQPVAAAFLTTPSSIRRSTLKVSPSSFSSRPQIDDGELLLEDVGEAALRQAAVQRHLAAFESAHAG